MRGRFFGASAIALAGLVAGCGNARVAEPLGNPPPINTSAELSGQKVFMANCNPCHVGGAGAIGPALNDKPLPAALIRLQVRKGLGAMPAFSPHEISDAELEDLIAYLFALRHAGPPAPGRGEAG